MLGPMYDPDAVAEVMEARGLTHCILCRNEADTLGHWVPSAEALRTMGAKAEWGGVLYALCGRCAARPDFAKRVQAKIVAGEQEKALEARQRPSRRRRRARPARNGVGTADVIPFPSSRR